MKRVLVGIAFAALALANLALLHRVGTMRARLAPARPPVERTAVVERIVEKLVPQHPPSAPEATPPTPAAEPPAEPEDRRDVIGALTARGFIRRASAAGDDPGLSDYQRLRLEEHKRMRDRAYEEADEIYDAAVRMELSAEQYEKRKAQPRIGLMITGDAIYRSGALTEFNP